MPRDPNIPDAFDVYTLVLLRRPTEAPDLPEAELAANNELVRKLMAR